MPKNELLADQEYCEKASGIDIENRPIDPQTHHFLEEIRPGVA